MEEDISEKKQEVLDNLLSLDGIEIVEESGPGKCLTLDGILTEDESSQQQQKIVDGEFQLDIEDSTDQMDVKIDEDNLISSTNLNQDLDFNLKNSDVLNSTENDTICNAKESSFDVYKVPEAETPSVHISNSQISEEVTEKHHVITEQEDNLRYNDTNNSTCLEQAEKIEGTEKSKEHTEDEEEVLLENILQKSKNNQSDSSDSEFDYDLPEKSNEPQKHKKSETSLPKTVISVSDIDFAFSSPEGQGQNVKSNQDLKIESEADKNISDLKKSVSKDISDELNSEVKDTDKITVTKTVDESSKVKDLDLEGQGQNLNNVITSPKKKKAPEIPTILSQDKPDSTAQNSIAEINADSGKKIITANGDVTTETNDQETFATNAAFRNAMDEWDNVQTIEAGFSDSKSGAQGSVPKIVQAMPLLSFYELQEYFKACDFSSVKPNVQTHIERRGFAALKNFLFGPPKLHRDLLSDREKVFCVAGSTLDNTNSMHLRSLQTIYRTLTGSRFDCGRYGSHWEEIGFQGNDPSTDLRGAGLLGLTNLIHFLSDPRRKPLAQDIYKLSLHPTQNFPFCVMGINISRITLQSLREDILNKECNKRKDVFGVVNDFYVGLYLQLYQVWKFQGKTIADSGNVIKHIETSAKKSPQHVFKNLEDYLSKKRTGKSTSAVDLESMDVGTDNFLGVCETEAGQY